MQSDASEFPLDCEQRRAVEAEDRAIAVLAGPGSGKTRALSYRARHLLSQESGTRALLLTFTNKATAEMKARALGVTVVTTNRLVARTYHTFAMRLLRMHGHLVGVQEDFEVLDDDERAAMAQAAAGAANTQDRAQRWSYLRLRRYTVREEEVRRFGERFQQAKMDENVLDFDDLLFYAANLLEDNPDLAEAVGRAHAHILIDEFQDTNPAQFAIVHSLWAHAHSISVFADDDQGIYQFAGAEPANIRRFIEELNAERYPLTTNYRCREHIVRIANRLIGADQEASGRQMRAHYDGGEVRSLVFDDVEEEAAAVGGEIAALIAGGEAKPFEIAVLARRRTRLNAIMEDLEARGVPVSNWLGPAFETGERQALATSLYVVRATLTDRQARRFCDLFGLPLTEERRTEVILAGADDAQQRALLELRALVWQGGIALDVVDKAAEALLMHHESMGDELSRIRSAVEAFQAHDPEFGVEHLLAELALGGIYGAPTAGGGVKVASLHRTKGLQWPRVYLVGLENETLPDYRADTPGLLSEERRTCFVGVCRAEEHLTLTRVRVLQGWPKEPSLFLAEMGISPTGSVT